MGLFSSKFSKADTRNTSRRENVIIADPRSPTEEVTRTPIFVGKVKPYLETDIDDMTTQEFFRPMPLHTKLLRSLKLDPRSPTAGINRTPIVIEGSPLTAEKVSSSYCDSPLSIYSTNFTDIESVIDVTAPPDPSVNVSGFDKSLNESSEDVNSLINQLNVSDLLSEDTPLSDENNTEETKEEMIEIETPLKVSDRPNTIEAQKLMEEILSAVVDNKEVTAIPIKEKLTPKTGSKIPKKLQTKKLSLCNVNTEGQKQSRTPLSNITSSANSPRGVLQLKKTYKRNKIIIDEGLENSPQTQRLAEWDQDNTVII